MKEAYKPFKIKNVEVKNRLVASAMFEYGAENGKITDRISKHYKNLSEGGFGLIITGMNAVSASGACAPIMIDTENNEYVSDLKEITDNAHKNGAKIFVQLQHCGAGTFPMDGYDKFAVGELENNGVKYHQASSDELKKVAEDFASSALKCKQGGADGVQIHAAHGFLINSFLSPLTNHRTDNYGGSIENRARLLFEIYHAIRNAVGNEYPVAVKFPFSDLTENSITKEDSLFVCKQLENMGVDMIEISSGMVMDGSEASFTPHIRKGKEAPFLESAKAVADSLNIPVISVCGYRTTEFIENVLTNTNITAISFGRPIVCESNFPNRWLKDNAPLQCVSCNGCCNSFEDGIITCQVKKRGSQK